MTRQPIEGIIVPIITPLNDDEEVDAPAMRRAVARLLDARVHGIFAMGSTGECAALTVEEWQRGVEVVIEAVGGRVPVLVGVSAPSTKLAIKHLVHAERMGANAAVATLPYYFPSDEGEMLCHYTELAAVASIPLYAYNIPLTKVLFTEKVVEALTELPAYMGMKDSSNDFTLFQKLILRFESTTFAFYQGNETMLAHSLFAGAIGGVLGLANVAPTICVELYQATQSHQYEKAYALQRALVSLHRISRISSSPLTAVKYATSLFGLGTDRATKPFRPLTEEQKAMVRAKLMELDLFTN